jgi:hypothetical protein
MYSSFSRRFFAPGAAPFGFKGAGLESGEEKTDRATQTVAMEQFVAFERGEEDRMAIDSAHLKQDKSQNPHP